ncbi:hypothetical protein ACOTJD_22890 [Achromobacter xylosoxidans]
MTDRELLELAAKAAGIEVWPGTGFQAHVLFTRPAKADPDGKVTGVEWNPLAEDGAALRLGVRLKLKIYQAETAAIAHPRMSHGYVGEAYDDNGMDKYAATRRAIVRAAAAIGKEM